MGHVIGRDYKHAPACLQFLLVSSRQRAKESGFEHSLTMADVEMLYNQQAGHCAVSGLSFSMDGTGDHPFLRPYAPSLDRIDNALGCTKDNVRMVCRIVNFAMGKWGLPALERVALAIAAKRGGQRTSVPLKRGAWPMICKTTAKPLQNFLVKPLTYNGKPLGNGVTVA
jgi:hypothetical protein